MSPLDIGLIVLAVALVALVVVLYLYFVVWALKKKPVTGVETMKGKVGVAVADFEDVSGEVSVDGVIWEARSSDSSKILKGDSLVVTDVSALELRVRKQ